MESTMRRYSRRNADFQSGESRCAAWLYLPEDSALTLPEVATDPPVVGGALLVVGADESGRSVGAGRPALTG